MGLVAAWWIASTEDRLGRKKGKIGGNIWCSPSFLRHELPCKPEVHVAANHQETRIFHRRGSGTGVGDRRQHGYFQRGRRGSAAAAAVCQPGPAGDGVGGRFVYRFCIEYASAGELCGLEGTEPGV